MKKFLVLLLALLLVLSTGLLAACSSGDEPDADPDEEVVEPGEEPADLVEIVVGASTTPHAEILYSVEGLLADMGYKLTVVEFSDYIIPNESLSSGELDANYFQHQPYLDNYNEERGTTLVGIKPIHYEPFGIYPGQKESLEDLEEGDIILVPNDTTNEARAFYLLEAQGLLKIDDSKGLEATINDIVENPLNLKFQEVAAEAVSRFLPDGAFGVINGNNALMADLNVSNDAVASEDADSLGASTFANVLAIREGDEDRPEIQALIDALTSHVAREFIENTYEGAVVPVF